MTLTRVHQAAQPRQENRLPGATVMAGFDKDQNTFGDWLITQGRPDGTSKNGILKVPASVVASYTS
jgi:hypothetical protein